MTPPRTTATTTTAVPSTFCLLKPSATAPFEPLEPELPLLLLAAAAIEEVMLKPIGAVCED